jgi:phosphinothricin acetyltransferase
VRSSIRAAELRDAPALIDIVNEVIATSTAIYRDDPESLDERRAWLAARTAAGYPVLVADEAGEAIAFASFGDFRAWPGYRHTVEHSVHVRADRRGRGVGPSLVAALLPEAARLGKHVMLAGVDAANAGSIRMHEKRGFERVTQFREVGRKFDRWLDLVFLQRFV